MAQAHSVKYPGLRKTAMFRGPLDSMSPSKKPVSSSLMTDLEFLLGAPKYV